jgi:hypothetical protein
MLLTCDEDHITANANEIHPHRKKKQRSSADGNDNPLEALLRAQGLDYANPKLLAQFHEVCP